MAVYTKSGTFGWAGGGKGGAVVDMWLASRFTAAPAEGDAPPSGVPDGGPVTTGPAYGSPGAFTVQVTTIADYFLRVQYGGTTYWSTCPANDLAGAPVTSGVTNVTGDGSSITVANGTTVPIVSLDQLSGDVTTSMPGSVVTSLQNVGVPGIYGDSTHVPQITTDAKGRVTNVVPIAVVGGGGGGGGVSNVSADSSITVVNGSSAPVLSRAALTGDITAPGGSNTTVLKNTGTAGTFGDGTHVAQITTDSKGRVTNVTPVAITTSGSGTVTNVTGDSSIVVTNGTTTPALTRAAITGDVTVPAGANGATLVGTSNVNAVVGGLAALTGKLDTATASATYAPIANPTLTGTPRAPTAAGGTNTTQIATTQFVQATIADTGWITVSAFTNGWAQTVETVRYRKIATRVYVQGGLHSGTNNTTAFTLPTNFRPSQQATFAVANPGGSGEPFVNVNTDGTVVIDYTGGTVYIDGTRFFTD